MFLREMGWDVVERIQLAQARDHWLALVKMGMNLLDP